LKERKLDGITLFQQVCNRFHKGWETVSNTDGLKAEVEDWVVNGWFVVGDVDWTAVFWPLLDVHFGNVYLFNFADN
jgi:hypothetical protein